MTSAAKKNKQAELKQSLERLNEIVQDDSDFAEIVEPLPPTDLEILTDQILEDLLILTESGQNFCEEIPVIKLNMALR